MDTSVVNIELKSEDVGEIRIKTQLLQNKYYLRHLSKDTHLFTCVTSNFSQRESDEKITPILGHSFNFVQNKGPVSSFGVMKGMHYQLIPYTQSKIERCVKYADLDVVK